MLIDSMLTILWNLASFVVVLGILVTFHEFGHFWVARKMGIKVIKFSIGFGKPFYRWYGRDGVEYVIAQIPLGGYVKMLDENDDEVAEELKDQAFNRASIYKRIAVVSAGPMANFLLAIFLFWLTFMIGIPAIKPVIGAVIADSPAAKAGLEKGMLITGIADEPVKTWGQVRLKLADFLGEQAIIPIMVKPSTSATVKEIDVQLDKKMGEIVGEDPVSTLGIKIYLPNPGTEIGEVVKGSAADRAGVRVGDQIKKLAGKTIESWSDLQGTLKNKAHQSVELTVEREGQWIELKVTPDSSNNGNDNNGYLGVGPHVSDNYKQAIRDIQVNVRFGVLESLNRAIKQTARMFSLSVSVVSKMISGDISVKNLSGPVGIAQGAGDSARAGFGFFLGFMAMISVSLGFLNLLPIPVLDGGHLLFYLVELVSGKPVSERVQAVGMQIGIMLILTLTVVALFNDVVR